MNIIRLSQEKFKTLMIEMNINDDNVDSYPYSFICINSSGSIHSIPYFKKNHKNVINLYFDDVEHTGPKTIPYYNNTTITINAIAMNNQQAEMLVEFIDNIDVNSTVYLHCVKGSSRSGAIEDYMNKLPVPSDHSNKYVFSMLRKVKC